MFINTIARNAVTAMLAWRIYDAFGDNWPRNKRKNKKRKECNQNSIISKLWVSLGAFKCHQNPLKVCPGPPGRPKHLFDVFYRCWVPFGTAFGVPWRALGSQRGAMATPKTKKDVKQKYFRK